MSSNPPQQDQRRRTGGQPPNLRQSIFSWRMLLTFLVLLAVNYLVVNVLFSPAQPNQVTIS